jgi:WD40 repeat protein
MGCSNERTVEKPANKEKGYPVCRLTIPLERDICSLVALNSSTLILGGRNELLSFDCNTKEISVISKEIKGRINCLIKTPEGKIISGGQFSKITVWDIDNKKPEYTLEGHTSIIWDLKYIGNDTLISGSDDNSSKIWNLKNKTSVDLYKAKNHISSIVYLNNKKVLLASKKNILLFDLDTKDQESVLDVSAWTLLKLKNGDVAAGLGNGLLYILEITDEIKIKLKFPQGHKRTINTIIELENNKIVTISDENDMILWDVTDPESIYIIKGHTNTVTCLCLIEGNKFASIAKDKTLKIWE